MIKNFILNRLREASTWRAIIGFVTIFGLKWNPDQQEAIAVAGASLICVVGAFFPDKKATSVPVPEPAPLPEPEALGDGELAPRKSPRIEGQFP